MSLRESLVDAGFKSLNRVHRTVLHVSGGRAGGTAMGMPVVELHTTGRRSGMPRTTMLTVPVVEGGQVVLVASKGGDDRAPDWYLNLLANPGIEVTMAGRRRTMRARCASAEEKAQLWPQVVAANPGYARYQRRTSRDIPLVICEPR